MSILSSINKFFFPFYKSKNIKEIFRILNSNSEKNQAMFVGGCVRKHLQNQKIGDIDVATILTPDEVIKKFEKTKVEVKKTGIEHGTLTLVLEKDRIEITTLRKDISTDGRHAKISFTNSWEEDSKRRDFTINSIYLDSNGKIFDPHSGVADLNSKKVKFIGRPDERIKEDYLRILRFIRFSIEYSDFDFDKETLKSIKINLDGIVKLSKERIYDELCKILKLKNFEKIYNNEILFDIFKLIFPEFKYIDRIKNLSLIRKLKDQKLNNNIILALLLIDETNNHEYFSHKYNISNETKDFLDFSARYLKQVNKDKDFFNKNLKKNIFYNSKNKIESLFLLHKLTKKKFNYKEIDSMVNQIKNISIPKFPVTGNYLLSKGIKNGKKIGLLLKQIEKKWIDNNFSLNDKEITSLLKKNI